MRDIKVIEKDGLITLTIDGVLLYEGEDLDEMTKAINKEMGWSEDG